MISTSLYLTYESPGADAVGRCAKPFLHSSKSHSQEPSKTEQKVEQKAPKNIEAGKSNKDADVKSVNTQNETLLKSIVMVGKDMQSKLEESKDVKQDLDQSFTEFYEEESSQLDENNFYEDSDNGFSLDSGDDQDFLGESEVQKGQKGKKLKGRAAEKINSLLQQNIYNTIAEELKKIQKNGGNINSQLKELFDEKDILDRFGVNATGAQQNVSPTDPGQQPKSKTQRQTAHQAPTKAPTGRPQRKRR